MATSQRLRRPQSQATYMDRSRPALGTPTAVLLLARAFSVISLKKNAPRTAAIV